ncbi:MAG: N-acetylglucosamine-6-phosphate deacetylase [Candidatus Omnitrophota bacterium]|nr:N-acetylglucosamine-6-phosphate deacetylase [Candidatus Omnitrophota bacterium]
MNDRLCIRNGRLVLRERIEKNKSLFMARGKIVDIAKNTKTPLKEFKTIDARGLYVSPGLIDIHVHGLFADRIGRLEEDDLRRMCGQMAKAGITGFLATTVSLPTQALLKATNTAKSFVKNNPDTNLLGLHLEGPYLNPSARGAQNNNYLRIFKADDLKKIFSAADGLIKIMTFAPECKNGVKLLAFLVKHGIVPAIGHSQATYKEVKECAKKGLKHVTHLFNAMPGFDHSEPGLIGAALDLKRLTFDIIADGIHVHPASVKFVIKTKGVDGVILISDNVYKMRLPDGRLAGSVLNLNQAVKNVMKFADIDLQDAVKMATINPAKLLGIQDRKGSLQVGKDADIVIFDDNLKVKYTIIKGNIVTPLL